MTSAMDFDTSDDYQKMIMRWSAAGHTVLHERGCFRHKAYKKEIDPETVICIEKDVPYLNSQGISIKVGDVLPERSDLCLDMNGVLLPQHEFEKRYREYLNWFDFVEGSDPGAEHIPNAVQYITQVPDTFSGSHGMVEANWDARKPAEVEPTHKYDPQRNELVEIVKTQGEAIGTALTAVKQLLEKDEKSSALPTVPPKRGPGRPRKEAA